MPDARTEGLRAASESLAKLLRTIAGAKTRRSANAVHVTQQGDEAIVAAGHDGGEWGWEPIVALMFDDNKRHPLFGNRRHWYHQGEYPMTELTVRYGADEAAEAYADAAVDLMLDEHGIGTTHHQ